MAGLAAQFSALYLSQSMSDVLFCVGDAEKPTRYPAHKYIMSLASPVMKKMFESDFKEKVNAEVHVPDVDPQAFKSVLSFIYTNKMSTLSSAEIVKVLYIADKYMLCDAIYDRCIKYLQLNMSCDNFYSRYETATMKIFSLKSKPGGRKLFSTLWTFFEQNSENLLQFARFASLEPSAVEGILKRDCMDVTSEFSVLEALLGWAEQRCIDETLPTTLANKMKVSGPLLKLIRFHRVNLKDLHNLFGFKGQFSKLNLQKSKTLVGHDVDLSFLDTKEKRPFREKLYSASKNFIMSDLMTNAALSQKQTILVAFSRDLFLTHLQLVTNPNFTCPPYVEIKINNMQDEELWNMTSSIYMDSTIAIDNNSFRPCNKAGVTVGEINMEAKVTYKMQILNTSNPKGLLAVGVGVPSGMRSMLVNGDPVSVVFKVHFVEDVSWEEVEKDKQWSSLLSKLDKPELDEKKAIYSSGFIRSFTFTE